MSIAYVARSIYVIYSGCLLLKNICLLYAYSATLSFKGYIELYVSDSGFNRVRRFRVASNTGKNWQYASVPIGNYPKGKTVRLLNV